MNSEWNQLIVVQFITWNHLFCDRSIILFFKLRYIWNIQCTRNLYIHPIHFTRITILECQPFWKLNAINEMPSTSLPPTPFFCTWNILTIGLILATLCASNGKYLDSFAKSIKQQTIGVRLMRCSAKKTKNKSISISRHSIGSIETHLL